MRSAHPPERLRVELQSRLAPSLSARGYRLVGHGLSGVTWRRDLSGKVIAGLVVLSVLALGGFAGGDAGSIPVSVACAVGGAALFYFKRPVSVTVTLTPASGGTEWAVDGGGRDAGKIQAIVKAVAGPDAADAVTPERPAPLWRPPGT